MMASRGMGAIRSSKMPKKKVIHRTDELQDVDMYAEVGKTKSKVNEAGVYTKPGMRKSLFESIKSRAVHVCASASVSVCVCERVCERDGVCMCYVCVCVIVNVCVRDCVCMRESVG